MTRRRILLSVLALIIAVGGTLAFKMFRPAPTGTDFARTRATANGLYTVAIAPEKEPFVRDALHSWIVTVKNKTGSPVEKATIDVGGGMPQHGHGLPTAPKMTAELGQGRYRVEGVKFSMFGWWEFSFAIKAPPGNDTVVFNLKL
ncbi:MAG: FixH family protein [Hyphomicrobiaceae bacterium]|nr:FixH family protein [Hyphomicrobiaceae bacterium]